MTDLTQFGVEAAESNDLVDPGDDDPADHRHQTFPNGRCIGINQDGTRCSADSGMSADLCHPHAVQHDPVTIESGPRRLIEATTRTIWSNVDCEPVRAAVERVHGGGA